MKPQTQLKPADYTRSVRHILASLEQYKQDYPEEFIFSDVVDEDGNQYINLVQEGGGVLGIALVGFTYVLEKMGIRFLSHAGTSAGSINALLLASIGTPDQVKSERILEMLTSKNFYDFVDGGGSARWLHNTIVKGDSVWAPIWAGLANWVRLAVGKKLGLNPGKEFERWLDEKVGQNTVADIRENMNTFGRDMYLRNAKGQLRGITDKRCIEAELAIIAADVTTETKVEFPRMSELYFEKGDIVNPTKFVRASMSVPGVFEPVALNMKWAAERDEAILLKWRRMAGYIGNELPKEVLLVDGGIMSNFPIDVFHQDDEVPNRPTVGIKLGIDRNHFNRVKKLTGLLTTCFEAARSIRDFEFLSKHEYYKDCIAAINVDGVNWLDFNLPDADRMKLFLNGAEAAEKFLRDFDWHRHRTNIKQALIKRTKTAMWQLWDEDEVLSKIGLNDDVDGDKEVFKYFKKMQSSSSKKVLLWIDDNHLNDAIELNILEKLNFECLLAESSQKAEAILNERGKDIDLIISDSNRNKSPFEGVSFCWKLLESGDKRLAEIPVIIRSGSRRKMLGKMTLPQNVKNKDGRNTLILKDLVLDIYDVLFAEGKNDKAPQRNRAKNAPAQRQDDQLRQLKEQLLQVTEGQTEAG